MSGGGHESVVLEWRMMESPASTATATKDEWKILSSSGTTIIIRTFL